MIFTSSWTPNKSRVLLSISLLSNFVLTVILIVAVVLLKEKKKKGFVK